MVNVVGRACTHPWDDLRLSFFSPLSYLGVDLVAELRLYFTRVTSEESEEPLCPAVDNIYLVQGDRVDNLLALLNLAFWALHELSLQSIVSIRSTKPLSMPTEYSHRHP